MNAPAKPLRQREMFTYALGDLGINLNFQLIGFYLTYFYTDVFGISPLHVAGLFLAARIWDALNDPLMGIIADHTRSRWGRFRPYLLFGAVPLNLVLVACFIAPDLSPGWKIAYAYVTYILHGMVFTAVGLPYSSLTAAMTQDQQERAVISTYRMFFAVIVALSIVSIGVKPAVAWIGSERVGFPVVVTAFAVTSTVLLWVAFASTKERVAVAPESYRLKQVLGIVRKNDALLVLSLAMFLNTCVWVVNSAVALYYFKYVLGDASYQATFFFWMLPANIAGALVAPRLTRRFGKLRVFLAGSAIVVVFWGLRHFFPIDALALFVAASFVGTFGQMLCSITQWGMLPDTVEYGEHRTGIRAEGILFAFFSFTQKLGMAVGGGLAVYALGLFGYVPNVAQSPGALRGISGLFNLAPAAFSLLCFFALLLYRLDPATFERIKTELAIRNAAPPARASGAAS